MVGCSESLAGLMGLFAGLVLYPGPHACASTLTLCMKWYRHRYTMFM